MDSLKATMMQAVAGMGVQSKRIETSAENISNVDTPGYQRKVIVPEMTSSGDAFAALRVELDQSAGETEHNPSHPMADENGYVTLSNVSLVTEMADLREANRTYEANLNAFKQARNMYQSLLDVLRS